MSDDELERLRTSFGSGVDAGAYDDLRPGYPVAAVRWLLAERSPCRVLDLGAGTGKLTATLLELGHDVVAVDPSAGMLTQLSRRHPDVDVRIGSGEAIPTGDASVDVVVVGQAWHWMDAPAAAAEVGRVLRPGGSLGLVWNELDRAVPWVAELDDLTRRPLEAEDAQSLAEIAVAPGWFGPRGRHLEPWRYRLPSPAHVAALSGTWSWVASSPERDEILRAVGRLAAAHTEPDGSMSLPYTATCFRFGLSVPHE